MLKKQHVAISRKRVERLMREMELSGRVVKVTRRMPGLKRFLASGDNLRLGVDAPTGIDQVWVADISYHGVVFTKGNRLDVRQATDSGGHETDITVCLEKKSTTIRIDISYR